MQILSNLIIGRVINEVYVTIWIVNEPTQEFLSCVRVSKGLSWNTKFSNVNFTGICWQLKLWDEQLIFVLKPLIKQFKSTMKNKSNVNSIQRLEITAFDTYFNIICRNSFRSFTGVFFQFLTSLKCIL